MAHFKCKIASAVCSFSSSSLLSLAVTGGGDEKGFGKNGKNFNWQTRFEVFWRLKSHLFARCKSHDFTSLIRLRELRRWFRGRWAWATGCSIVLRGRRGEARRPGAGRWNDCQLNPQSKVINELTLAEEAARGRGEAEELESAAVGCSGTLADPSAVPACVQHWKNQKFWLKKLKVGN